MNIDEIKKVDKNWGTLNTISFPPTRHHQKF
jgi:hypothetical protein